MDLRKIMIRHVGQCFPRTRGDGPCPRKPVSDTSKFPPHTRGWTAEDGPDRRAGSVSPAHAGMDPRRATLGKRWLGFPRTRGDGPGAALRPDSGSPFPPHTRGWTHGVVLRVAAPHVSPAHAGMDPGTSFSGVRGNCFPRTRGDGPEAEARAFDAKAFPPHTRGWTLRRSSTGSLTWVSPAHAGMDRRHRPPPSARRRFPRTRGDGPASCHALRRRRPFPPHTRGWTRGIFFGCYGLGVSPAHAGMDPDRMECARGTQRFPRTRGDGPGAGPQPGSGSPFPPHTRGWTCKEPSSPLGAAVSPAHAGMDRRQSIRARELFRFPRTRGDGPGVRE